MKSRNVVVSLILALFLIAVGATLSAPMPELHLRDIGRKSNGATAGEVVKQVWSAMLGSVSNLASRVGSAIKEGASGAVEGVKKHFK